MKPNKDKIGESKLLKRTYKKKTVLTYSNKITKLLWIAATDSTSSILSFSLLSLFLT